MPIFYDDNHTPLELTEPQLTRWRSRYRGQRESLKNNTESNQMGLDLTILYAESSTISDEIADGFELLEYGGTVPATVIWFDATPNEESVVIPGLQALASDVAALMLRLKNREN